jgi:uncharacterized membrane protein
VIIMDLNWLFVSSRWLHIIAAVVAVGGAAFIRFVLLPAARSLPADQADALRVAVRRRWAILYMLCVVLLLVSGLYNYMAVAIPAHRGQSIYHALFGLKFILAMVVFFIGSALVGRAAAFEPIRRNASRWLALNVLIAALVIAVACILKFIPAS